MYSSASEKLASLKFLENSTISLGGYVIVLFICSLAYLVCAHDNTEDWDEIFRVSSRWALLRND